MAGSGILIKKWNTAKNVVNPPQVYQEKNNSENGILFFGTSKYAAEEAMDVLKQDGIPMDAIRIKSFPFNKTVEDFVASHKKVFVIEQNRDAQMKSLLMIELQADAHKLISVLNYDGYPITADNISKQISKNLVPSQQKVKA